MRTQIELAVSKAAEYERTFGHLFGTKRQLTVKVIHKKGQIYKRKYENESVHHAPYHALVNAPLNTRI